jgi:hypothetical protein
VILLRTGCSIRCQQCKRGLRTYPNKVNTNGKLCPFAPQPKFVRDFFTIVRALRASPLSLKG